MYYISIADPNFIPVPGNQTEGQEEEELSNHSTSFILLAIPLPLSQ